MARADFAHSLEGLVTHVSMTYPWPEVHHLVFVFLFFSLFVHTGMFLPHR